MDDTLLGGDEFEGCQANIRKTLQCLENLGFFIHPDKSIFIRNIIFIGFNINTQRMTIAQLTTRSRESNQCHKIW